MAASKRIRLFAEFLSKRHSVSAWICSKNNGKNENTGSKKGVKWSFIKFNRIDFFLNFNKIFKILKSNYKNGHKNVLMLYDGIGLTNFMFAYLGKKMGYIVFTDIVEDYSVHEENTGVLLTCLHKINQIFDKNISKYVNGIVVISKRLFEKYHAIDNSLQKILIPISAENINLDIPDKIKNENFSFVYSGSYGVKDGVSLLIECFKLLNQKYQKIELILSGKINVEIKNLIKDELNIKYIGMVPDSEYYHFLANSDVLCMTRINSKYAHSGFPFKLGEYLASGVPVIVTNVSDISDYLINEENALVAVPSNVTSLFEKMEFAYLNQKKIKNIGSKGKEVAHINFNKDINGEKLEQFIQKL